MVEGYVDRSDWGESEEEAREVAEGVVETLDGVDDREDVMGRVDEEIARRVETGRDVENPAATAAVVLSFAVDRDVASREEIVDRLDADITNPDFAEAMEASMMASMDALAETGSQVPERETGDRR